MGRANSGCHLHSSTTRLSRLERSGRCMDKHRRRVPFRRTEWCRPGARLVECGKSTVRFTAEVSRPPETTSAHRRQPLRIGRRLHVNRSDPRQNFQVWNWKPHRERAAAVGSRARTVAEKFGVICSRCPVGDVLGLFSPTLRTAKRRQRRRYASLRRDSIISHNTCSKSWCASCTRAVESLLTKRSRSAMPTVDPPSRPRTAMVFI